MFDGKTKEKSYGWSLNLPKCPICSKPYKKSGNLRRHLMKLNGEDYSVAGNSIGKRRTIMEFLS
jgi:hypothetical protein